MEPRRKKVHAFTLSSTTTTFIESMPNQYRSMIVDQLIDRARTQIDRITPYGEVVFTPAPACPGPRSRGYDTGDTQQDKEKK